MDNNIVVASFTRDKTITRPVYQYDYGLELNIVGGILPDTFEIHFANDPKGEAKTQIVENRVVAIPDEYLLSGKNVYAWIFLHRGADDGETVFLIEIPVRPRAAPSDDSPTPVEQSAITEAIAALQDGVEEAAAYANDAWDAYDAILALGLVAADDGAGNVTISFGGG